MKIGTKVRVKEKLRNRTLGWEGVVYDDTNGVLTVAFPNGEAIHYFADELEVLEAALDNFWGK
jgi:RNase P/RNase MRP subunit p29